MVFLVNRLRGHRHVTGSRLLEKQLGAEADGCRFPFAAPAVDERFIGDLSAQEAVDVEFMVVTAVRRAVDHERLVLALRTLRRSCMSTPREKAGRRIAEVPQQLRDWDPAGRRLLCGEKRNQDEYREDDTAVIVPKWLLENH